MNFGHGTERTDYIESAGFSMKILTTDEIAEKLAGGQSYIRTKDGDVKGLAIRKDKNPEASDIILVGTGPKIVANAHLYLRSGKYVPVFIKRDVNKWEYVGDYKAVKYCRDAETIEKHRHHRLAENVDGILFLEKIE